MGCDIEEYPFIFMNTPASLQILASVEMALMVWRCKYANTSHLYEKPRLFFEQKISCKEVLVVPVPHRIEAQINEKMVNIGKELREWINFHSDRDFLNADSIEPFRKCFQHIVVDFSGSVGYKASVINMLNSGEFSDVVNYKIACTFCLEDRVKRFWPSVANESRIDVNSEHGECNLSYWNARMKSGGNSIADTKSVRSLAKKAAYWRNDAGFDYFSKMLPDRERVSEFISLLRDDYWNHTRNHPAVVVHSLLLRIMDRVQAEEVFKERASSIFTVLTKIDKNFQYVHQLWTLMGHLILENQSQFFHVIFKLWMLVFYPNPSDGLNYTQYGQINDLLLEIWSYASDELKAYVSNTFLPDELIDHSDDRGPKVPWPACYGHDMTFVLDLMSNWSNKNKKKVWQKNWRGLALRSEPVYLQKFVRICLPRAKAIELFKNQLAQFEDLFRLLIDEGFYSDLKDYVKFCTKDAKQFQQLGKKVLGWNVHIILFHDDDKFSKFEWFVSEVFANVQKDIEEFKTKMISSAKCLKNLLVARQADKISSNDFSRIIGRFVTDDEGKLQQVKRKLLNHCRTYPVKCTTETYNADQWQAFLEWCTGDHEEISAFKLSFNVDVIFLKRLKDYLDDRRNVEILYFLDDFLKWYFGNEKDAKIFKLEKVKNYQDIDILRVPIERDFSDGRFRTYTLLVWLFDNDSEKLREFFEICTYKYRYSPPHSLNSGS